MPTRGEMLNALFAVGVAGNSREYFRTYIATLAENNGIEIPSSVDTGIQHNFTFEETEIIFDGMAKALFANDKRAQSLLKRDLTHKRLYEAMDQLRAAQK